MSRENFGTIVDLGVSEGNDSAYYLAKGFQVIGVEADPTMAQFLKSRFRAEISSGLFKLLNFAASDTFADDVNFFISLQNQGASGINKNPDLDPSLFEAPVSIKTINWQVIRALCDPHYVKIDIEGNEVPFLKGMASAGGLPEFISIECIVSSGIDLLYSMGYRRFKLIEQQPLHGFRMPDQQLEGLHIADPSFDHASGPFGQDVFSFNDWTDFEGVRGAWENAQRDRWRTWHDCHAWMPKL